MNSFESLLAKLDIHPILVDIGASGKPPEIWNRIASRSIYLGFDPDARSTTIGIDRFMQSTVVDKAVTELDKNEISFYLTKYPPCSSVIQPDLKSLSNFLFCDHFNIEREVKVNACTLGWAMKNFSLSNIHWLKIDSQGTDLRLFRSIEDKTRVLALDVELGLINSYIKEDLFVDAHRYLTQNGFWLSNLGVQHVAKMKKSNVGNLNLRFTESAILKTPFACDARYFRTVEWLSTKNEYVLLWVFVILDGQYGFALDLTADYERIFGEDMASKLMRNKTIGYIKKASMGRRLFAMSLSIIPSQAKELIRRYILR